METPEKYIQRLKNFNAKLAVGLPPFMARQAMDAKALVQSRVQEKGLNAEEASLGIYTSEPYKKQRQKKGRQVAHVDLTMTRGGAGMFGSTGLVEQSFENGIARVVVAGKDEFTQDKLEWNSERYGDVLAVSAAEEKLLDESFTEFLQELIDETAL